MVPYPEREDLEILLRASGFALESGSMLIVSTS